MEQAPPKLTRFDKFFPQWECLCQYTLRAGGSCNFNWNEYEENSPDLLGNFRKKEELKQGILLLSCQRCSSQWVLSCRDAYAWMVKEDEVCRLQDWHRRDLRPSPEILKTLKEIGEPQYALEEKDLLSLQARRKKTFQYYKARFGALLWAPSLVADQEPGTIPCRVTFRDASVCDTAQIGFGLPAVFSLKEYRLLDEVVKVEPSPLALPLIIRQESLCADEIQMGVPMLFLRGPSGNRYAINARNSFFRHGADLGSEMCLDKGDVQDFIALPHGEALDEAGICADYPG